MIVGFLCNNVVKKGGHQSSMHEPCRSQARQCLELKMQLFVHQVADNVRLQRCLCAKYRRLLLYTSLAENPLSFKNQDD